MPIQIYTILDDPLASSNTDAAGTKDMGQMVGWYDNASGNHGFLYSNGTYTPLDEPLANAGNDTEARGINGSGQVVGFYNSRSGYHGFLYNKGAYTTLDD